MYIQAILDFPVPKIITDIPVIVSEIEEGVWLIDKSRPTCFANDLS